MTTLPDFADLARREQGLGVVSTLRADLSIHSSVVNLAAMSATPPPRLGMSAG
ncbi:hypothetical protein [Herbidospora solisilvae]|uniref:hypothetical protein n=1 Tax=Herbidospora solisilvae TaxID=2696284 RepID=UPI0019299A29|nr:hypothetical protein [Herbidospora solisilvae]